MTGPVAEAYVGTSFSSDGELRAVIDPSTGEPCGSVVTVGADAVARAVEAAREAQHGWRATPPAARAAVLARAAELIEARAMEISGQLAREGGRPLAEASGEVAKTVTTFRYYAGLVGALDGRAFAGQSPDQRHETRKEPVGLVAAITPWNVPAASPARKLAPALLAGNAVLLKPATATPISSWHLVTALYDAGLPAGLVQLLPGDGAVVGAAIATHPAVGAVSFTGSTSVGLGLQRALAGGLTKLQLELGGKNGAIVLADADLESAADHVIAAAFASAGQQCTATSRVIVESAVADQFTRLLIERAEALVVGAGADAGAQFGPLIDEKQLAVTQGFVDRALAAGAVVSTGGHRLDRPGSYFAPTVLSGVSRDSEIAREEVFGPVLSVLAVGSLEEAIGVLNDTQYGLSAAVHTRSIAAAQAVAEASESGIVAINGPTAGIELAAPFGGFKNSGTPSKEHGPESMDFFTRTKLVSWRW